MLPRLAMISAVVACAASAAAPLAWGASPGTQRTLTCNDGSVFTVEYVTPDTASGINSTFKIRDAVGPAASAKAFAVKFRTIYDDEGAIVFASGAKGPGKSRNLVACTFPSDSHPGYVVEDIGFYVLSTKK